MKRALVFFSTVAFVWGGVIVGSCYQATICLFFYACGGVIVVNKDFLLVINCC